MSTVFPCQPAEELTTIPQTQTTDGNRLLTWLFWENQGEETRKKFSIGKKDKDSKEPVRGTLVYEALSY